MSQKIDEALSNYINSKDLADVKFVVGSKEEVFYAHKIVISMVSTFFKNIFYSKDWENKEVRGVTELTLPNIDAESFKVFLEFAYQRHIEVKEDQIFKLLNVSEKFKIEELKKYCIETYDKTLNKYNCISYYEFGKKNGIKDWTEKAMHFIEKHSNLIFENESCLQKLSLETIKTVLGLEKLLAREIHIFKALVKWAEYQKETKHKDDEKVTLQIILKDFLEYIRLDLMSFDDLQEIQKTGLYSSEKVLEYTIQLSNDKKLNLRPLTRGGIQLRDIRVLLLGSCRRGQERLEHLKESIMFGGIQNVTIVDIGNTCPSFELMKEYDAIVLRGRNGSEMNSSSVLGDRLAGYVESGKSLIVIAINTLINSEGYRIKGRILDEGFIPLAVAERVQQDQRELGEVHLPDHPIMHGVETFKTKDYTHVIGTHELNDGTLIASWNNGFPLITEKRKEDHFGTVVCLNFHPISTKITNDCGKAWLQETDGAKIISNAANYISMQAFK
ncbi:btb/poz domain-containing [Anaeramoeba flamelloides]|uniref:Btb/poz domain-containing n=1 Tax=Anaeramoeba flamelloides TaxID=1746091 RepID=A0ABQ8YM12_9EUKA|nr:btb/poz domain-containing [Anaeramoeba flamelloides]